MIESWRGAHADLQVLCAVINLQGWQYDKKIFTKPELYGRRMFVTGRWGKFHLEELYRLEGTYQGSTVQERLCFSATSLLQYIVDCLVPVRMGCPRKRTKTRWLLINVSRTDRQSIRRKCVLFLVGLV